MYDLYVRDVLKICSGNLLFGSENIKLGKFSTDTRTISNAFVGYYPSDKPRFSIALTFPNIMRINGSDEDRSYANKRITRKISELLEELY